MESPQEVLELSPEKRDSVELKMDAKGNQYWIIKLHFDRATEEVDDVIADIERIDRKMREKFGRR